MHERAEQATQQQNTHKLSFGIKKEMHSYLHVNFILSNPEGIVESVWRKWYWILLSLLSTILNFDFLGGDSECKGSILWLKEKVHQCKPSESF